MNRLTIATLNLERGEAVELLPELTAQAGEIDLLMQEGGNWHRDGHRAPGAVPGRGTARCGRPGAAA